MSSDAVRVTETIRHRGFVNVAAVEAGSLTEGIKVLLERSPHMAHRAVDEPWIQKLWDELLSHEVAQRGWADYRWEWL